tara:strand:- start:1847 stop:2893 length:1047 start_codon:yes stop_codon:yes gene_type:complete
MSEQTIETEISTEFQPDSSGNLVPQSEEEKFFGVKTEIPTSNQQDEVAIEVLEDTGEEEIIEEQPEEEVDEETLDEEIKNYSKRAGKRIDQLIYEREEQKRQRQSIESQQQEAVTRLKTLMQENQRLQAIVDQGGQVLNQQATNNAQWAKLNAQAKLKAAYDEGDADKMAEAQEELTRATLAEQSATSYSQNLQNQLAQQLEQEQLANPVQEPQQLDPDMQAWSQKNPWFMSTVPEHQEMTSYAMTIDRRLRNQGVLPENDSKLYYEEVDKAMRREYPSFFGVTTTEEVDAPTQEKRQPQNVVAPASRTSGSNKNSRKVRLDQDQVKLARQLGITPEQYAKQLLLEES